MAFKNSMKALLVSSLATSVAATSMAIVPKSNQSMCLDLLGERTVKGTPIDVWECTPGLLGQQWFFDAGTYRIRSAVDGKKCIDASESKLSLNDCSGNSNSTSQFFGWDIKTNAIYLTPEKGDLKPGSMCLQITTKAKQGDEVKLAACNATDTFQQWAAVVGPPQPSKKNETFTFSPGNDTKQCLDLQKNGLENGSPVVLAECAGGKASQEWVFTEGSYRISNKLNPDKCIDATSMAKGIHLIVWDCNGFPQQQWGYQQSKTHQGAGIVYLTQVQDGCLAVDSKGLPTVGACDAEWRLTRVKSQITIV